ncbi:hypothetical protein PIB30_068851, partial [Stylosanthes scabra]|nr:hypothetical protein [Stylosanthes scabra]
MDLLHKVVLLHSVIHSVVCLRQSLVVYFATSCASRLQSLGIIMKPHSGGELPADLPFRERGPKHYRRITFPPENPTVMSGAEWKKWEGKLPAEFSPNNSAGNCILRNTPFQCRQWLVPADFSPCYSAGILHGYIRNRAHNLPSFTCNQNRIEGTLIEPPPKPPNPCRRHSPSSPRPNLRSPPVVFSVTDSRGEGSLEYHQDPHLGNGAVDPTLAIRVCWRRRGDVAAATTTVEPPSEYSEDRTSKARTTTVLPRSLVFAAFLAAPSSRPVTPSHPLFNFNHRSPLKAQFSLSATPLNVSSLLRCSTTVT